MAARDARSKDGGRVLDAITRSRRQKKALESLEQDNYQEEPHADLVMSKRAPKFQEALDPNVKSTTKKRKIKGTDYYKKYRKSFPQLVEEDLQRREPGEPSYTSAPAPPSKLPKRHFCNVCGYIANYTCVKCGIRFCSVKCNKTHQETRCLKWTA